MLNKLQQIATTYEQLQQQLYDPAVAQDTQKLISINKQLSQLTDAYELYKKIKTATDQRDEAKAILATEKDPDMLELAQNQLEEAQAMLNDLE